jgi:hypothetical protein
MWIPLPRRRKDAANSTPDPAILDTGPMSGAEYAPSDTTKGGAGLPSFDQETL